MVFALMIVNVLEKKIVGVILVKIVMPQITKVLKKMVNADMIALVLVPSDVGKINAQIVTLKIIKDKKKDNVFTIANVSEISYASKEIVSIVTVQITKVLLKDQYVVMIAIVVVFSLVSMINVLIAIMQIM